MTELTPTVEQQNIIKAYSETKLMKITAAAGAAKTTTLTMLAESNDDFGLYLAFNKAMAEEAANKFPSHVVCRTTHSMAYSVFGRGLRNKLQRPRGGYVNVAGTNAEVLRYYNIKLPYNVNRNLFGLGIKMTVARFESSSDSKLTEKHVPNSVIESLEEKAKQKFLEEIDGSNVKKLMLDYAVKLWKDRCDTCSPVLATHDTYLKLYQLSKPKLDYDVIYLDEAQDTSDCVLDIVLNQDCKVVIVGDSRQAIYEWRGAVNAMNKVQGKTMTLSQSFRYGPIIGQAAEAILEHSMVVKGFEKVDSKLSSVDEDKPYALLFRTNSALVQEAVDLVSRGVEIAIEADIRGFVKKLQATQSLFYGDKPKHEEISIFEDFQEMKDEGKTNPELNRLCKLVEEGLAKNVIATLNSFQNSEEPSVVLTTAHKSKGREFDQVCLAQDFPSVYNQDGAYVGLSTAEQNLLYVAATRAKRVLEVNTTLQNILERDRVLSEMFKDAVEPEIETFMEV